MYSNEFSSKSKLNLKILIDFWRKSAEDSADCIGTEFAKRLVEDVEKVPELLSVINDLSVFEKHEKLIDALMSAVFPASYWNSNMQAITSPLEFRSVYATDRFEDYFVDKEKRFDFDMSISPELYNIGRQIFLYSGILKQFYGVDMTVVFPLIRKIKDKETGLERYFKMNLDNRFVDLKLNGELKPLKQEDIILLSENMFNLELWHELIQPQLFEFEGFLVVNMFEVTDQEALSQLKFDLLDKNILNSAKGFETLEIKIKTMFRNPNLRLGLATLTDDKSRLLNSGHRIGSSFLLSDTCLCKYSSYSDSIYQNALDAGHAQIIYDLSILPENSSIEKEIVNMGVRNILVAPLKYEGENIGILEIGSSKPGDLNAVNALKLIDILPLFSLAMKRSLDDIENRVQAIIKEKCTSIHPAVEWRFRKAAMNLLDKETTDEYAQLEEIVFREVYPLYALSDIRNSSNIRNSAIQSDLKENLALAKTVINSAAKQKSMPVLDHLNFRIEKRISALDAGLHTGDEASIVSFLKKEIEPLFDKMKDYGDEVKSAIEKYALSIDGNLGLFYNKRKEYEQSVAMLNESISSFVDAEQDNAQDIFPHYFEKYKTDGVEFTMYIGDSISEKEKFDPIYLKNIRLWQFLLMCKVAARAESIKPKLKVPLELAHLILVQNLPLSIRFHLDQKRFDVDGTYNVHYEIMKKRIDKAEIRGREERLTQPGKIAVIYTQSSEAAEYMQYIEYLQSKGYLEKEIEELELEDLQGVYGLKALRVAVNLKSQIFDQDIYGKDIKKELKEFSEIN